MRVRFLRPAEEEYLEAVRYYTGQAVDLGAAFLDDLDHATGLISDHAQVGAPYDGETRRQLLRRFPYGIIYVLEPTEVLVVAVRHHRQEPVRWRERLGRRRP